MKKMSRRDMLRLGLGGAALAFLSRCVPDALKLEEESTAIPPEGPFMDPTPLPLSTPGGTGRLLQNENRPGFYIRYYKPFPPVDRATWRLHIEGLVNNPLSLRFEEMEALPLVTQKSRMKCVEGWSVAAKWGGFHMRDLVPLVDPQSNASWVHFYSADDYYESLSLEDLLADRVLFAYQMNNVLLLDEYGAPLRLIVPPKYGYKGPKAIVRLVFSDERLRGYWPTVGPYTEDGAITAGRDFALDLNEIRQHGAGEVFYPDGIETMDDL